MNCAAAITRVIAASTSPRMRAYCALRSTMGTATVTVSVMFDNPRIGDYGAPRKRSIVSPAPSVDQAGAAGGSHRRCADGPDRGGRPPAVHQGRAAVQGPAPPRARGAGAHRPALRPGHVAGLLRRAGDPRPGPPPRHRVRRARRTARRPGAPEPRSYYLATLHRQENVDDPRKLQAILGALEALPHPTILPVHPRTKKAMGALRLRTGGGLRLRPPATYLEMLMLESGARAVLTDSG